MALSFYKIFACLVLLSCCVSTPSFAYLSGPRDSASLTENAQLVCKIQVLSLEQDGIVKGKMLSPPFRDAPKMIASAKVLSVIKGEAPDTLSIEYYGASGAEGTGFSAFTQLKQGETCLVFLGKDATVYKFHDIHNGKMEVPPQVVDYKKDVTPLDKLLSELVAAAEKGERTVQLQAIKEIGAWGKVSRRKLLHSGYSVKDNILGDSKARAVLQKLGSAKDVKVRGLAAMARLQLGESPGIEAALSFFTPVAQAEQQGTDKQRYDAFSIPSLQTRFLETVDYSSRFSRRGADGNGIQKQDGSFVRGVKGFDYAEFCKQVLQSESVKHSEKMREHIGNTIAATQDARNIPDAVGLLNDTSLYVRSTAVGFLRQTVSKDDSQLGWETYQKEEPKHLAFWKKWWEANESRHKVITQSSSPRL